MESSRPLSCFQNSDAVHADPYPRLMKLLRVLREQPNYQNRILKKLNFGKSFVIEFGNLYSAALPAWLGAGLEDALHSNADWAGASVLSIGYGSGDAAEAIPMRVAANWKEAAKRLNTQQALENPRLLTREEYVALHEGTPCNLTQEAQHEFVIQQTGTGFDPAIDDVGIDYYDYIPQ